MTVPCGNWCRPPAFSGKSARARCSASSSIKMASSPTRQPNRRSRRGIAGCAFGDASRHGYARRSAPARIRRWRRGCSRGASRDELGAVAGGDELRTTLPRAAALNSSVAMTIPAIFPSAWIRIGSISSAKQKTPSSASDEGMTKSLTWRSLAIRSPLDNSLIR